VTKHDSLGFKIAVLALVLTLGGLGTASAGKPPHCSDVPISVTFLATTAAPAAIWNDLPDTVYQNGVDGVEALIHYNSGCDGTRDATLGLGSSTRTLVMKFPAVIPDSNPQNTPPSFVAGAAFATKALFNVHNILGYPTFAPGVAATFYTKVTSTFPIAIPGSRKSTSYRLAIFPDTASCPAIFPELCSPVSDAAVDLNWNSPEQAAWVKVTYTPGSGPTYGTWLVEGEQLATDGIYERATLVTATYPSASTYGQYSMPFKILITALAPLQ
jgi:hypothetical protein